jgi:hypothetical protein
MSNYGKRKFTTKSRSNTEERGKKPPVLARKLHEQEREFRMTLPALQG